MSRVTELIKQILTKSLQRIYFAYLARYVYVLICKLLKK